MYTTIKFAKTKSNAIIPTKRDEDAGYDIYPCFDEDCVIIKPHETVLIPTGIAAACDTDYCFVIKERSSTGTKGMAQRCGVIDSGYRGEILVPITNTSQNKEILIIKKEAIDNGINNDLKIRPYSSYEMELQRMENYIILHPYEKAIAQLLLIPVPTTDVEEYTYEELKAIPSKRGVGKIGSSGK